MYPDLRRCARLAGAAGTQFDIRPTTSGFGIANSVIASPRGERRLLQVGVVTGATGQPAGPLCRAVAVVHARGAAVGGRGGVGPVRSGLGAPVAAWADGRARDRRDQARPQAANPARSTTAGPRAGAFNETLARPRRTVGEMRQFSAALAHELAHAATALLVRSSLACTVPQPTKLAAGRRKSDRGDRSAPQAHSTRS